MGVKTPKHVEELLITNKSLIVASSWSHLYLLFKDARSFLYKVFMCWLYSLPQVIVSISTDTDNGQYQNTNNMYVIVITNGQNQT